MQPRLENFQKNDHGDQKKPTINVLQISQFQYNDKKNIRDL